MRNSREPRTFYCRCEAVLALGAQSHSAYGRDAVPDVVVRVLAQEVVLARLELSSALTLCEQKSFDKMGRFMLRDKGKTIAIGLVTKLYDSTHDSLAKAGKE